MKISDQIYELVITASKLNVSDIHFQPVNDSVNVYYRLKDILKLQAIIPVETYQKMLRFIKFKANLDISMSKFPQDGSFEVNAHDETIFVRISTVPLIKLESLVIRIISEENQNQMEKLSFNTNDLREIYQEIKTRNGLFIFTGPTGSGKSTSMYSILNELSTVDHLKVITIENPVEVINENLTQVQINELANLTYSTALKSTLRQDPDVIMIGEIRDDITAKAVFRAALTGHTVISTMHTKNKYGVIERFLDFGFVQSEISSVLIGISNQRLVVDYDNNVKAFYDYCLSDQLSTLINNGQEEEIGQKIARCDIKSTIK